nr:uncharacterized protein LOC111408507 [Ipomoea batatas]
MKKWADEKRRPQEYTVGDQALIKFIRQQFKAFQGLHNRLVQKYEGPFPIVAKFAREEFHLKRTTLSSGKDCRSPKQVGSQRRTCGNSYINWKNTRRRGRRQIRWGRM